MPILNVLNMLFKFFIYQTKHKHDLIQNQEGNRLAPQVSFVFYYMIVFTLLC